MSYIPTSIGPDDSAQLSTRLMANFNAIAANIGGGGNSATVGAFAQAGRLLLPSGDVPPQEPPSPALALVLPIGFTWLQDGDLFVVSPDDGAKVLSPLPANFDGYIVLDASRVDDAIVWAFTTTTTRPPLGSGTLAQVTTDADSVTALVVTEAESDVIPAVPILAARLRALSTPSGSGGGGGGGGGAPVIVGPSAWQQAPGDERATEVVIQGKLDELEARVTAALAAGGTVPVQPILDLYAHRQAILIMQNGRDRTLDREDFEGAYVEANIGGDGTGSTVNHVGPGTMTKTSSGWTV